jgi:hypothetical protein
LSSLRLRAKQLLIQMLAVGVRVPLLLRNTLLLLLSRHTLRLPALMLFAPLSVSFVHLLRALLPNLLVGFLRPHALRGLPAPVLMPLGILVLPMLSFRLALVLFVPVFLFALEMFFVLLVVPLVQSCNSRSRASDQCKKSRCAYQSGSLHWYFLASQAKAC